MRTDQQPPQFSLRWLLLMTLFASILLSLIVSLNEVLLAFFLLGLVAADVCRRWANKAQVAGDKSLALQLRVVGALVLLAFVVAAVRVVLRWSR